MRAKLVNEDLNSKIGKYLENKRDLIDKIINTEHFNNNYNIDYLKTLSLKQLQEIMRECEDYNTFDLDQDIYDHDTN